MAPATALARAAPCCPASALAILILIGAGRCFPATFENVASQAELTHEHYRANIPSFGDMQSRMSGGAAAVDYDNDG